MWGFVDKETRFRKYQEVLDIRGRKNGKTTELAADELFMLIADNEGSPEVYNIATKYEQAQKGLKSATKWYSNLKFYLSILKKKIRPLFSR